MPLRVIQHYSDWVCTAVMSNDVMKDLRGKAKYVNKDSSIDIPVRETR